MNTQNNTIDLFGADFAAFATPEAPAGSVVVTYGISVDVVQVTGEATIAPQAGMSVVELAKKYAAKANMPTSGLRVFIDGQEVPFDKISLIPAEAKTVEFRQPGSEKGAVLLPMREEETFVVEQIALDLYELYEITQGEDFVGVVSDLTIVKIEGLEVRPFDRKSFQLVRKFEKRQLVDSKVNPRFVASVRKTGKMTAQELRDERMGDVIGILLNGYPLEDQTRIVAGDVVKIFIRGISNIQERLAVEEEFLTDQELFNKYLDEGVTGEDDEDWEDSDDDGLSVYERTEMATRVWEAQDAGTSNPTSPVREEEAAMEQTPFLGGEESGIFSKNSANWDGSSTFGGEEFAARKAELEGMGYQTLASMLKTLRGNGIQAAKKSALIEAILDEQGYTVMV